MQPDAANARQQIVERIKQSTNILVAVSTDPTVDELSAALGLALMLNKMDKHATAVFSGKMPPAMDFLNAKKTFENTVDSLRDFIISLDKEKADRLRYKVENDAVRIFITPYKTTISEKDLQFSQGDFNVELIIALGVEKRDDLDKAIVAHGRILHDATVVTVNAENQKSSLGAIEWHDGSASSLCEMLVSMAESFQMPALVDAQISTALLTGIVAATDRFSNQKTNPKIMTMAAQLMAAGANQQLIATNLGKAHELTAAGDGELSPGGESVKLATAPKKDGELDIEHVKQAVAAEAAAKAPKPALKPAPKLPVIEPPKETDEEAALAAALPVVVPVEPMFDKLKAELTEAQKAEEPKNTPFLQEPSSENAPGSQAVDMTSPASEDEDKPKTTEPYLASHSSWREKRLEPPELGGTLSATSEEALHDNHQAEEEDRNKMLLSHDEPLGQAAASAEPAPEPVVEPPVVSEPPVTPEPVADVPVIAPVPEPLPSPPLPPLEAVVTPDAQLPEPLTPTNPGETPAMPNLPVVEPNAAGAEAPAEPAPAMPPLDVPSPVIEPPVEVSAPVVEPPVEVSPTPDAAPLPPLPSVEPPAGDTLPAAEPTPEPAPAPLDVAPPTSPLPDTTPGDAPLAPAPDLDAARQAVNDALGGQAFNPANEPLVGVGANPLGGPINPPAAPDLPAASPLGTENSMPPLPPMPPMPSIDPGQPLPPPPVLDQTPPAISPAPDFNAPPPLAPPSEPQGPAAPYDPGQFKIPGQ